MEHIESWKETASNGDAVLTEEEKNIINSLSPNVQATKDFFFEYSSKTYNQLDESFGHLSDNESLSETEIAKLIAIDILMRRLFPNKTEHYNSLMKSGIDSFRELLKLKNGDA